MNNKFYVVVMVHFCGTHDYFLGLYKTKEDAEKATLLEKSYRGGKYDAEIIEVSPFEFSEKWKNKSAIQIAEEIPIDDSNRYWNNENEVHSFCDCSIHRSKQKLKSAKELLQKHV